MHVPVLVQGVLANARIKAAHHSVDSRKAKRAGSVKAYAAQVLLPRLQVAELLQHVLVEGPPEAS